MSEDYQDWQDFEVKVVRNHDMICSIWPAGRENAPGWFDVGHQGAKEECLAYINEHCDLNGKLKVSGSSEPSASKPD